MKTTTVGESVEDPFKEPVLSKEDEITFLEHRRKYLQIQWNKVLVQIEHHQQWDDIIYDVDQIRLDKKRFTAIGNFVIRKGTSDYDQCVTLVKKFNQLDTILTDVKAELFDLTMKL